MRRIARGLAVGVAAAGLASVLTGGPAPVEVPLAGPEDTGEEVGGAGGPASSMTPPPPLQGGRRVASGARGRTADSAQDFSTWQAFDAPGVKERLRELRGSRRTIVEIRPWQPKCRRYRTPWEDGGGMDLVAAPAGERVAAGVTERAYAILRALIRLDGDPPEPWRPVDLDGTPSLDAGWDRAALVRHLYARMGQAAWNVPGAWIGEDPPALWAPDGPLRIHQTAAVHREIERVLDGILGLGGDARTVRVWRGALGPGTLRRGELRRLEGPAKSIPGSAALEEPVELDVPVGRAVSAFVGRGHTVLSVYEETPGMTPARPVFELAHAGLSVRGRIDPRTDEIELEIAEATCEPPFPRVATSVTTGGVAGGEPVPIEVPERSSRAAVVRLSGAQGDAWLVGLGGGRAAVVELGDTVPGAGSWRRGWGRTRSTGFTDAPEDPPVWEDLARADLAPPPGEVYVGLVRPSRAEGTPAWESRVRVETGGLSWPVALHGFDLGWEEALPHAGLVLSKRHPSVLRGGTCVSARWVGGTADREAYDVLLSVAEPLPMREGPPVLTCGEKPTLAPCRLPSFVRALVPLRIVVPHDHVARRIVWVDLGRGPEAWTLSVSRGRREE